MYVIKFKGNRGTSAAYLTKKDKNYFLGEENEAEKFSNNEAAIDAACELTKHMAMFGLETRSFVCEKVKTDAPKSKD